LGLAVTGLTFRTLLARLSLLTGLSLLTRLPRLSLLTCLSLLTRLPRLSLLRCLRLLTRLTVGRLSASLLSGLRRGSLLCGFGIHHFGCLLETLQSVANIFSNLRWNRIVGIALSLSRLLGELCGAVELVGGILSGLSGLLQLGLIQSLSCFLSVLNCLLGGL
jgi:hypothetical protein